MLKEGFVYILTNIYNKVLYIGVTSNLEERILEHKNHTNPNSFSAKYKLHKLVYFEHHFSIEHAIEREKQLKKGKRQRKVDLINELNPSWIDLSIDW